MHCSRGGFAAAELTKVFSELWRRTEVIERFLLTPLIAPPTHPSTAHISSQNLGK